MEITGRKLVLVTGATGFIGGHLAQRLLKDGYGVRVFVRHPPKLILGLRDSCEVVVGDLQNEDSLLCAVQGVDIVFHCAANVNTWDSMSAYDMVNGQGVRNLMNAIKKGNPLLSRLVHLSSADVYGFPDAPCQEEDRVTGGDFGYGQTKLLGENWVRSLGDEWGISYTILRPCNVIGPGSQFIERIGKELKSGVMLTIDGGYSHAGLIYIDNLVDDVVWAGSAPSAHRECFNLRDDDNVDWATFLKVFRKGIEGRGLIINLSYGVANTLARVLNALHRRILPRNEPLWHPLLVCFFGKTCGHSPAKIRRYSPARPRVNFDEAMLRSVQWFKDTHG